MLFAEINNMWPDEALERATSRENCASFSFQRIHLNKDREELRVVFLPSEEEAACIFT